MQLNPVTTIQETELETFIEEGTPGEPGHWRTLYIHWADGLPPTSDKPTGVSVQEVIDVLIRRIEAISPEPAANGATILRTMLSSNEYAGPGTQPAAQQEPDPVPEHKHAEAHIAFDVQANTGQPIPSQSE